MNWLGIEIGGTKLQLGVGCGDGTLVAIQRRTIHPERGAAGICASIEEAASSLLNRHPVAGAGIGFGGPVQDGVTIKSHQVAGWEQFPLQQWAQQRLGVPVRVANDCDAAALAEATCGAGRGASIVFYVTVGTGVGGGLVVDQELHGAARPAVAEIGHLRPGLQAGRPEQTVESVASGWGITAEAAARVRGDLNWPVHQLGEDSHDAVERRRAIAASQELQSEYVEDLLGRCDGDLVNLTAIHVANAAAEGNQLAQDSLDHAWHTLGWAIAQVITLTAAERVIIGGGVSLLGEQRFFEPVRKACAQYVFPPLAEAYQVLPAALGEEVVVHGAIANIARLARQ